MGKFKAVAAISLVACLVTSGITGTARATPTFVDGHCKFKVASLKWKDLTTRSGYSTPAHTSIAAWNATPTPIFVTKVTSGANMELTDGNYGAIGDDGGTFQSCVAGYNYVTTHSFINRYYADGYSLNKRQSVIVHEFGHALGLDHVPSSPDCTEVPIMHGGTAIRYELCGWYTPKQDDIDGINFLY